MTVSSYAHGFRLLFNFGGQRELYLREQARIESDVWKVLEVRPELPEELFFRNSLFRISQLGHAMLQNRFPRTEIPTRPSFVQARYSYEEYSVSQYATVDFLGLLAIDIPPEKSSQGHDSRLPESLVVKKYSKSLIRMPTTGSCRETSRRRTQGSPEKIAASPLVPPSSERGSPNTALHLDYQQRLNSNECYDDSINCNRHEQDKCSINPSRIHGSQYDMLGESGFVGGDEASFVSGKDIEFPRRDRDFR